jgi:serine/threonine protein kinase
VEPTPGAADPATLPVRADPDDGRPAWALRPGTEVAPGLRAWSRLAVGHRRETWLCWSARLWEPVLLKLVRPGWRPFWTDALRREVRALRGLEHPSFPRLLADGLRTPLPHLVTEYLNGPALDEVLDDEGLLGAPDCANLAVDLLAAVRFLHARGWAHLDVCPDNVVTVGARARLIDLGAARRLGSHLTAADRLGTEGFTAPEVEDHRGSPVTGAMDVWSVGATLRAALDEASEGAAAVAAVLDRLTDADPARRPVPDAALADLVRLAGPRGHRPWPWWADRDLVRPRRPVRRWVDHEITDGRQRAR